MGPLSPDDEIGPPNIYQSIISLLIGTNFVNKLSDKI